MKPTEQQDACVAAAKTHKIVKIEAGAGSGKTSTLKLVSKSVLESSLYVAFNTVTANEAAASFPPHVTCKTVHSVAYAVFGRSLQHKLKRPTGAYKNVAFTGSEIARFYKLPNTFNAAQELVTTANAMGLYVRHTVERFESSADTRIERKHLPMQDMKKMVDADHNTIGTVLRYAEKLWKDRTNVDSEVMASHDTYLKKFQMTKPNLGYKVIYLDEAQDSTPCVLDIVMMQAMHGAKIILVGDRYQAIYGWRGAINAMERIDGVTTLLSKSFRFGQGVADVATAVLQGKMKLTGREDLPSVIGGAGTVDRTKPHMFLFRTNAALLYAAVVAIGNGEEIRIEVDVKDFIRKLQSAYALSIGDAKNVKHEEILPYPTWKEYTEEAKIITGEMKRIVTIIEGGDYQRFIRTLENYQNPASADKIYTTGHKAKGREHDQVILCDDFPSHYDGGEFVGLSDMEQNLLYVAVTRSMRVLEINDSVREAMDYFNSKENEPTEFNAMLKGLSADHGMEFTPVGEITNFAGVGAMRGDMAVEAMHNEMGLNEPSDPWRDARRADGYSESEIDMLEF